MPSSRRQVQLFRCRSAGDDRKCRQQKTPSSHTNRDEGLNPRGATLVRRSSRKRRTHQVRGASARDTLRPGNGGVSGGLYWGCVPVRSATPRPIPRSCPHRLAPTAGSLSFTAARTLPDLRRVFSIARQYSSPADCCQSNLGWSFDTNLRSYVPLFCAIATASHRGFCGLWWAASLPTTTHE